MATLIQQPDTYNFAGNIRDIILASDQPVSFLLDGELEELYHPDAGGRVTIPLRAYFEARLPAVAPQDIPSEGLSFSPHAYSLDGAQAGSFCVLPGGVASGSLDTELFLKSNFLTWQPQTRYVSYHEPQWLRYAALTDAVAKVKGYFPDGTFGEQLLQELSAGRLYSLECNYGRIRGLFEEQPLYYDIWTEDTAGSRLSFVQRYVLRQDVTDTVDLFVFENSLGGFDTIRFTGDKKEIADAEGLRAVLGTQTLEWGVDYSRAWTKYTGYFPDERTRLWSLDFFSSRHRFHVGELGLWRIYVTDPKLEATRRELAGYEFTFAYAQSSRYQNLARGEVPERLEIVGPGEQLFFLIPRLNEFPILDASQDVLIPAQYAHTEQWGVIHASALGGGGNGSSAGSITGAPPIRVTNENGVTRISHLPPEPPDSKKYNQWGNVDSTGHVIQDYHPYGGDSDMDLVARQLAARSAQLQGNLSVSGNTTLAGDADIAGTATLWQEVKHPEYVPGVLGQRWGGTPGGDFWFNTLGAREGITTSELIYNRQSVEGNVKYFTDGIAVESVDTSLGLLHPDGRPLTMPDGRPLITGLGEGLYHILPKDLDGEGATPFREDDILVGYFRHEGLLPRATYLRVIKVYGTGGGFLARLIEGAAPERHMVLARRGNYTDPDRQNSIYVDAKAGKMLFLRGVNTVATTSEQIDTQLGYIGDILDPDFPDIGPGETGLYAQNACLKGRFVLKSSGRTIEQELSSVFEVTNEQFRSVYSLMEQTEERVTQSESTLSQTAEEIASLVRRSETLEDRITTAESSVTQSATQIASLVRQTQEIEGELSEAYSLIGQQAREIALKVDENGVIAAINLSPEEVLIEADKIRLVGDVDLGALTTSEGKVRADFIDADELIVRNLRTRDTGARIEIDRDDNEIKGTNVQGYRVFSLTGLQEYGGVTSLTIGNEGYLSRNKAQLTQNGVDIMQGPASTVTAQLYSQTLVLSDALGVQRALLSAGGDRGQLRLSGAQVYLEDLASRTGVSGSWVPLYINTATGEVRAQ